MTPPNPSRRAMASIALLLFAGVSGLFAKDPTLAVATNAPVPIQELSAVARIVFRGTSTLHDFEGRVTCQPFQLLLSSNTWSAQGEVIAADMTTASERRDRKMWTMLSTNQYPRLTGKVENAVRGPTGDAPAQLSLRIRGKKTNLPVIITDWAETTNGVRFHASWDVSLKQFGIKPPSALGVIRVGDRVHIDADITATPAGSAGEVHSSKEETRRQ